MKKKKEKRKKNSPPFSFPHQSGRASMVGKLRLGGFLHKNYKKYCIDGLAISATPTPGLNRGPPVIEGKAQPRGVPEGE
jgi:hypothetical protein